MLERIRKAWAERRPKEDYERKWPQLRVKRLIYYGDAEESGAAIVFIDSDGDLDWYRDDKSELYTISKGFDCKIGEIWNEVSALEPLVQNWPADLKLAAKRALGEALARAFRCDEANAERALKNAKNFLTRKSREVSRYWTLQACVVGAGLAALVGVASILWADRMKLWIGATPYLLLLAACSGAVGALLSVILRLGTVNLDAKAERRLHFAEALARIIAGGISGVLVGGLVRIGVLLPVFAQADMATTAVCCVALLAGASERLVPSIITKVESNADLPKGDD